LAKHLYFIKLLTEALQYPDPLEALERAFAKIIDKGRQPEYKQGYKQFLHFMDLVRSELGGFYSESDSQLLFKSDNHLRIFKDLINDFEPEERLPGIIIERDGDQLATLALDSGRPAVVVDSAQPGNYSISLNTGRKLWQGQLGERDLIWREAFPDEPLPLAAETDQAPPWFSREIELIPIELVLRVVPGRRKGRLEIIYLC
jgi:hypothetical protein